MKSFRSEPICLSFVKHKKDFEESWGPNNIEAIDFHCTDKNKTKNNKTKHILIK